MRKLHLLLFCCFAIGVHLATAQMNALRFDGVNDHVSIGINDGTSIGGGDAITIEYWYKGSNNHSAVRLQVNDNYIVSGWNGMHILSNDGGTSGISVGYNYNDGQWHHFAFTWQKDEIDGFRSYLDGSLVDYRDASGTALPAFTAGAFLGALSGNSEYFSGTLDEVRIWNVARSAEDIANNMATLSLPQTGLVAYYRFNQGNAGGNNASQTTVTNLAQNNFHGTLIYFSLNGNTSNFVKASPRPGIWFTDNDGDGFGAPGTGFEDNTYPAGVVDNDDDCNDSHYNELNTPPGDPSVFGDYEWNVYAFNGGGALANADSWNSTYYAGFYTTTEMNFNSTADWDRLLSPSSADNYQGCLVRHDYFSFSAKRKGFDEGLYYISVPAHDDEVRLLVNGTQVFRHVGCCDSHSNIFLVYLGANDAVELQVTEGEGDAYGALSFDLQTLNTGASPEHQSIASGSNIQIAFSAISPQPNGSTISLTSTTYSWSRNNTNNVGGIPEAGTGNVTGQLNNLTPAEQTVEFVVTPHFTNGTHTYNGETFTATVTVAPDMGNPGDFGINQWKVHAWGSGDGTLNTTNNWNDDYGGFYTVNELNLNTTDQWDSDLSPYWANGYNGSFVDNDYFSFSAKRKGFPCSIYQVNINAHDDAAQLIINGEVVWEHNGCCDEHLNVVTLQLGADDEVEFRVSEAGGGAVGHIEFVPLPNALLYPDNDGDGLGAGAGIAPCSGNTTGYVANNLDCDDSDADVGEATNVWFADADGDGFGDPNVGIVACQQPGGYVDNNGDLDDTDPDITTSYGDPSVPGDNKWRVHVWNSGDGTTGSTNWNTNYSGYYEVNTPGFNSTQQWAAGLSPSAYSGYRGLPVNNDNFSFSALRKGFACGTYKIVVKGYDDAFKVLVNGNEVGEGYCCTSISDDGDDRVVFEGSLGADDVVELRFSEAGGDAYGVVDLVDITPLVYADNDGDGIGAGNGIRACEVTGGGYVNVGGDCDDNNANVGAATTRYYRDNDGDGYGDPNNSQLACVQPTGYVSNNNDCNDGDANVGVPPGNPAVFGDNEWMMYAFNAGTGIDDPDSWNTGYRGFSKVDALSFSSWDAWEGKPSNAANYQGCAITADDFSVSYKRKGFPCGLYTLEVDFRKEAELIINGEVVFRETDGNSYYDVWHGFLGPDDEVEYRTIGGTFYPFANIYFNPFTQDQVVCSGTAFKTIDLNGSFPDINFAWTRDNVTTVTGMPASGTGNITGTALTNTTNASLPVTFSVTDANNPGCAVPFKVGVNFPEGDPAVFGDNVWRVYAWNAGGALNDGVSWSSNYAGYYTSSSDGVGFDTYDDWNNAPSDAPNYHGCPVQKTNYSFSAKRQGFPCGYYELSAYVEGGGQLYVNNQLVWSGVDDDNVGVIWKGTLTPDDKIEFRLTVVEDGELQIYLDEIDMEQEICSGSGIDTIRLQNASSTVYTWTRDNTNEVTGIPASGTGNISGALTNTTAAQVTVNFTITPTNQSGVACPVQPFVVPIHVNPTAGDPSVFGTNNWRVYTFNAGNFTGTGGSWTDNYAGFYQEASGPGIIMSFNSNRPQFRNDFNGCRVTSPQNSTIARRKGFDCGFYNITAKDLLGFGKLVINGQTVWSGGRDGFTYPGIIYSGIIDEDDEVEFGLATGSGNTAVELRFDSDNIAQYLFSGEAMQPIVLNTDVAKGTTYTWSRDNIAEVTGIAANGTGNITGTPVLTNSDPVDVAFSITPDNSNIPAVCGNGPHTALVKVIPRPDSTLFGIDKWIIHFWNGGGRNSSDGKAWNTDYRGQGETYSRELILRYDFFSKPENNYNYQGKPVNVEGYSFAARRQGFPCGIYKFHVREHYSEVQIYVNGVLVFQNAEFDYNADYSNVWEGKLGPADKVEVKVTTGNSFTNIDLRLIVLEEGFVWKGTANNKWSNPANWLCQEVPDENASIKINSGNVSLDVDYDSKGFIALEGQGSLTVEAGKTLTISNYAELGDRPVILKSDATGTAALGNINYVDGAGNVTVERYLPAKAVRKNILVSSPVGQTIANAWQQQVHITGPGTGGAPCANSNTGAQPGTNSNGFDVTGTNNPSMFTYISENASGLRWATVPNTNAVDLQPGKGYRLFVRGPRSQGCQLLTSNTASAAVTLSATGSLNWGNRSATLSGNGNGADGFTLLGNPYPAPLNFSNTEWESLRQAEGISPNYWAYDPANPAGNYSVFNGALNQITNSSLANPNIIASGQAFFVYSDNAAAKTIDNFFKESFKSTTPQPGLFRQNAIKVNGTVRVGLRSGSGVQFDEAIINFAEGADVSRDEAGRYDARSINDGSQTISSLKGGTRMAIQTRPYYFETDSVWLRVSSAATGTYVLHFSGYENYYAADIYLHDAFTGTDQNLKDNPQYTFSITANAATQGQQRFVLVFKQSRVLPVTYINLQAARRGPAVALQWQVGGEEQVAAYLVQRAPDGRSFSTVATVKAQGTGRGVLHYAAADEQPLTGTAWYRILAMDTNGDKRYSSVVKVDGVNTQHSIVVYPNPAKDVLGVQLTGLAGGQVLFKIIDNRGAVVSQLQKAFIPGNRLLLPLGNLPAGNYTLQAITPTGETIVTRFVKS